MTAASVSANGYVTTGSQSFAGLKEFTNNLYATTIGDATNVASIQLNSRQLLVNNGSTISVDWSGVENGSAYLSFNGSKALFSNETQFGGTMYDHNVTRFLDPNNRVLYASDGSTSMLDFLNAGSAGVLFNSSGTFTGRLGSATEAFYGTGPAGSVSLAAYNYALNATGNVAIAGITSGPESALNVSSASGQAGAASFYDFNNNFVVLGDGNSAINSTGSNFFTDAGQINTIVMFSDPATNEFYVLNNGTYLNTANFTRSGGGGVGDGSVNILDGTYAILATGSIKGTNVFSANYDLETLGGASDSRFKTNVTSLSSSTLDKILSLNPVTYNWNQTYLNMYPDTTDASSTKLGFIAQDMELVFPEVVTHRKDGYLSIDYGKLTAVLTQGMKEMYTVMNDMKTKVQSILGWFGGDGSKFDIQGDVCVEDVCVTKQQFKKMLLDSRGNTGGSDNNSNNSTPSDTSTTTATSTSTSIVPEVVVDPKIVPEPEVVTPIEENVTPDAQTEAL